MLALEHDTVADQVCATSGVIATLTCGVLTQAYAKSMINDKEMMESFWGLVEVSYELNLQLL
jgi:NhaP-type Na+/H+ or K+/H+ antiporter